MWLGTIGFPQTLLAVVGIFLAVIGIHNASAQETAIGSNDPVAAVALQISTEKIVETSQGIDRVLFSRSPIAQMHFRDGVLADPTSRHGNHAGKCTFTEINPPGNGDLVMTPQLFFSIDVLPDETPDVDRKSKGTLTAIYGGFRMKSVNGWFPEETKFGIFGSTFNTQAHETPASSPEFVRVPAQSRNENVGFSLPIDLTAFRKAEQLYGGREISMRPCAMYEDRGLTEWIIYSKLKGEGVEISLCQGHREYEDLVIRRTSKPTTQNYSVGDMVRVSNLTFRIVEIVKFDKQVAPTAWMNIADISVKQP